MCDVANLLPAYRYLTGERDNICRLCFDGVMKGNSLEDIRQIDCLYYDKSVTFADMLSDLGVPSSASLPLLLCEYCSELTLKAFLFQKLSLYSYNKWFEAIERLNKALDSTEITSLMQTSIATGIKTAYIIIKKESNNILIGRVHEKSKESAAKKVNLSIKRRHIYKVSNKNKYTICSQCGEKVKQRSLSVHMKRKHTRKILHCPNCHRIFKNSIQLRDHSERVHLPKKIPCFKCEKRFGSMRLFRLHENNHHKAVTCKLCFQEFPSRDILNLHLPTHEQNQCVHCLKLFKNKITLTRHLRTHNSNPDNYVMCDICKKKFVDKRGLVSHMATEHGFGANHTCEWCKKSFDAASKLKAHVVKHTKEKSFSCEKCGGVFVSKAALVYHLRIHTGEKPFSCDICGEKFLNASRRTAHLRRKHLEPQFVCSVCDSKFYSKSCLNKHFGRHKDPQSKLYVSEFESKIK